MNIEAAKAVLDEMDGVSGDMYDGSLTMHEDNFHDYARRIRDALEEEEPRQSAGTRTPNPAAMRDALISIVASVKDESEDTELPCVAYGIARRVRRMAEAALAAPPRNCDVGTAEDKVERFGEYCISHKATLPLPDRCRRCRIRGEMHVHKCIFEWEQMPYEKGVAK